MSNIIIKKLQSLDLPENAVIDLTVSQGTDVFVHNETEVETALAETSVIDTLAELITESGINVTDRWSVNILESLREEGHLENYKKGTKSFKEYIANILVDNFYDQEFVEVEIEKYDHKRGFCTLSAEVRVPFSDIVENKPSLDNWYVSVQTEHGYLTIDI